MTLFILFVLRAKTAHLLFDIHLQFFLGSILNGHRRYQLVLVLQRHLSRCVDAQPLSFLRRSWVEVHRPILVMPIVDLQWHCIVAANHVVLKGVFQSNFFELRGNSHRIYDRARGSPRKV